MPSSAQVNLAISLALHHRLRVGVLDADIYGPSIPTLMGLSGAPAPHPSNAKLMLPLHNHGVQCMSMGFLLPDKDTPVVWRGPMASTALQQLSFQTAWDDLDVLVVDFPPGTGDVHLTLTQRYSGGAGLEARGASRSHERSIVFAGCVVVSTPQELALVSAVKGLRMLGKVDVPVWGIVENMAYFQCGKCADRTYIFGKEGARAKAAELGVEFLGDVPIAVNPSGSPQPVSVTHPDSPAARAYAAIAAKLAERLRTTAPAPSPRMVID